MLNAFKQAQKDKAKNESEFDSQRRQHVPYILNGELYRIQSQDGDNVKVICCYCPPDKVYRGSVRSTGNFHMHIKRRHTSLLGKLHEMKVAALVERRDRIMRNRRFSRARKKTTTVGSEELVPMAGAELDMMDNAELKIKTVFQRHKEEHNEQQEGTRTANSSCTSTADENIQLCKPNCRMNTCPNTKLVPQDLCNLRHLNASLVDPNNSSISRSRTMISMPRSALLGQIKPEQTNNLNVSLNDEQPEAMDLSTTTSKVTNSSFSNASAECISHSSHGHSMEDIQMQLTRSQKLSLAHFVDNSPPKDIMLRLDRTLSDIRHELNARNEIEHKRLLFEAAKFQHLNPNFRFE